MLNNFFNIDLQKIHPLTKLVCLLIFVLSLMFIHTFGMLLMVMGLICLMILWSKKGWIVYFEKTMKFRFYLFILFFILLLLSLSFTLTLIELIKLILLILYLLVLNFTTPFSEIVYAVKWFLRPLANFNIDINNFSLNIALLLKFVFIFTDEYDNILYNHRGKCYNVRNDVFTYFNCVVVSNFNRSFRKVRNIKNSMYLKLYDYNDNKYSFRLDVWDNFDRYIIIIYILSFLLIFLRGVIL